jgi:hypothetical protein
MTASKVKVMLHGMIGKLVKNEECERRELELP